MKKIQILFLALLLSVMAMSCRHRSHHVMITSDGSNSSTRIEYSGRIVFTADNMGISSMAPNSYLKYKHNDEKLAAECDRNGHIVYELNGNDESNVLTDEGKRLLAEAVKQIAKTQGNRR